MQPEPFQDELCRVPIGRFRKFLRKRQRSPFAWDYLAEKWHPIRLDELRPGHVIMLHADTGGYDPHLGFDPDAKNPVIPLPSPMTKNPEAYGSDPISRTTRFIPLDEHLIHVEDEAKSIARTLLRDPNLIRVLALAGRWHDVGKAHPVFQKTLVGCEAAKNLPEKLWAKSPCSGHHERRYFRHELASALAWLEHHPYDTHRDLIAYLIAAHHGKIRLGIRALPDEDEWTPDDIPRFARGIWEGDSLPAFTIKNREPVPKTVLTLEIMEIGHGTRGASWIERTQHLLQQWGPFKLAGLEALLRIADWRASRKEQNDTEAIHD